MKKKKSPAKQQKQPVVMSPSTPKKQVDLTYSHKNAVKDVQLKGDKYKRKAVSKKAEKKW